jgi:hypothetical protein
MRRVRAKLVKTSMCECGALAVWEHTPLGKEYVAYPDTTIQKGWTCQPCGRHHTSPMVMVDDGVKPLGFLFAELFEFDEGIAA